MRASVIVALLAVVAAGAQCKRTNGAYCDAARPCPSGLACDETARECHALTVGSGDMSGGSTDMAGCTCSGTTPICVANTCVSCLSTSDPEGACSAISPSMPHCLTSGGDAGSCVGCRDANDCTATAPYCDATTHLCRGCIADSECPSQICDLTPASTTHGLCVAIGNVVYADKSVATDGNGLSPTTPRKKIQDAINQAVGMTPARPYVHVAAGSYDENVGVNNKTIYIVGADGAIIHPSNNDALGAQGNGSLTVRNLIATAVGGNAGNCQNASFTAYRSQFINSSQVGIYTLTCQLLLDGVWVHGNSSAGISLSGGNFTIINSIITKNVGAGGVTQVTAGTTMVFANNTVADNTSGTTANAGVNCAAVSSFQPVNTIFYNNKLTGGAIAETNCTGSFDANDDATTGPQSTVDLSGGKSPGFKGGTPLTPDSYHLLSTSPCRNEASPLYAPDHDFDFAARSDGKPDIGADEVP